MHELNQDEIKSLYEWIDAVAYSRPKRNIARDFSDGVACAELLHHYVPKMVDIHNYSPAHSISHKLYNWNTLNCFYLLIQIKYSGNWATEQQMR
jgi:hypothetical protein